MNKLKIFFRASPYVLIILVVLYAFLHPSLGSLEGNLRPVTKDLEILQVIPAPGGILVSLKFNKVRDCDYVDLAFYEGERDGFFKLIPYNFGKKAYLTSRPVGVNITNPWFIETDSMASVFADVRHNCSGLWTTRTRFIE